MGGIGFGVDFDSRAFHAVECAAHLGVQIRVDGIVGEDPGKDFSAGIHAEPCL
jgi:hypothetical protein